MERTPGPLKPLVPGGGGALWGAAAAAGVPPVASPAVSSAPAVQPVVWDIPMPQAPAPELQSPLLQTLQVLAGGGSFSGKAPYIQGGIGRIQSIAPAPAHSRAAAQGKFPRPVQI